MARVNIAEAKINLSRLVDDAIAGEDIVIARRGVPLVRLVVIEGARTRRLGTAVGLVTIAQDFDTPLSDFADYR